MRGSARHVLVLLDRVMMVLAGGVLIVMMVHISLEALLRVAIPSVSLYTLTIVSAWYMVAVIFLPMAYAGRTHGHISVGIFARLMPSRVREAVRRVVLLSSAAYLSIIGYLTLFEAIDQTIAGEIWETSTGYLMVWPARWFLPISFFAMAVHQFLSALVGGEAHAVEPRRKEVEL